MRFAWAQLYLKLAEKYSWTFDAIDRLTPYQAYVAAGAISPEHGRVHLSPDESRLYAKHLQRRKEQELNGVSAR